MGSKRRMAARLVGLGALVVLMTGCIKLDMNLTVTTDDTVSGTVVFGFSKQLLQLTGQSADQLFKDSGSGIPSDIPGATAAPYEDDQFVGRKITFDQVPLSRFNTPDSDIKIEHVGDEFHVSGTMDTSTGSSGTSGGSLSDVPQQFLSTAQISISMTFPGPVSSASGEIDGNTVTWTPKLGETTDITATAGAVASGGGFPWVWVLVGALVLIAVVVLVVVVSRRGKGVAQPEAPEAPALTEAAMTPEPPAATEPSPTTDEAAPPPPPPPPA